MFGIRLLSRSAIASTSTSLACTSNATRWTSQRHFSLSRILNEEKSNDKTFSSQSSTEKQNRNPEPQWKEVADLAQSTAKEGISLKPQSHIDPEKNARLWKMALMSVAPSSHIPQSSHELAQAARKLSEFEQMEDTWRKRKTYGPDRPALPSDGRSIAVSSGGDFARAMTNLNSIFRVNNIRTELRLGERYEKPNQKRRRLASERHRRRFAHMVREKVQLVSK
jgi:ribosomal protein S21